MVSYNKFIKLRFSSKSQTNLYFCYDKNDMVYTRTHGHTIQNILIPHSYHTLEHHHSTPYMYRIPTFTNTQKGNWLYFPNSPPQPQPPHLKRLPYWKWYSILKIFQIYTSCFKSTPHIPHDVLYTNITYHTSQKNIKFIFYTFSHLTYTTKQHTL